MAWQEHLLRLQHPAQGDRIPTVRNGGEVRVTNHLVDGYDPTTQTVYEFHGCLWHGCPRCFPRKCDRYPICHTDRTIQEVYESTLKKHAPLRQRGYHLQIKWECDWDMEVKTDPDLRQFLDTFEIVDPLEPQEAFFGGRTNAVKLNHVANVTQGEKIKNADLTSLYPWVNKKCEYPVGHPQVIVNPEDQDIHHYFGMAKVDILPPHELHHPVLPFRHGDKLIPTLPLVYERGNDQTPLGKIVPLNTPRNNALSEGPGAHPKSKKPLLWDTRSSRSTKSTISHQTNVVKVSLLIT